jgi:hypothetical protein
MPDTLDTVKDPAASQKKGSFYSNKKGKFYSMEWPSCYRPWGSGMYPTPM